MIGPVRFKEDNELINKFVRKFLDKNLPSYLLITTDGVVVNCALKAHTTQEILDMQELANKTVLDKLYA